MSQEEFSKEEKSVNGFRLFSISFLALFAELLLIRWLPLRFTVLGYYSNLVLISALFGWGLGLLLARKWPKERLISYLPYFSTVLIIFVLFATFIPLSNLPLRGADQFIWNGLSRSQNSLGIISYLVLFCLFILSSAVFVTLGQEVGISFEKFKPLNAYIVNIGGSILGVVSFSLFSFFSTPPVVWFSFFFLFYLLYEYNFVWKRPLSCFPKKKEVVLTLGIVFVSLFAIFLFDIHVSGNTYWSPYYEITRRILRIEGKEIGFGVFVNNGSHQQALDLSGKIRNDFLESRKKLYELPYSLLESPPSNVLILGAGTGNDAATALREGASSIDAVEIDPLIVKLGKDHPEYPYSDTRVHIIIDDARAYLARTNKLYDLISFGFVDSHRLFSSMSSIRLENYLYTKESFQNVKNHLKKGGILAITYTVHEKWIADRIYSLLSSVFRQKPLVFQGNEYAWGTVFLVRNGKPLSLPAGQPMISASKMRKIIEEKARGNTWGYGEAGGYLASGILSSKAQVPTDNWPHLFLQKPSIPSNYYVIILLVLLISILATKLVIPKIEIANLGNWSFFFLGAAFALIETKGITNIAVVLGSTWVTNAAVITAILIMCFLSALAVIKFGNPNHLLTLLILILVILLNYFVPLSVFSSQPYVFRATLASLQVALPIFFSGILFATYFKNSLFPSSALGANVLGSVFGGLLEYTSMIWGSQMLFLWAIFLYSAAFITYTLNQPIEKR